MHLKKRAAVRIPAAARFVHFYTFPPGTSYLFSSWGKGSVCGENIVLSRQYLKRRAADLLKLSQVIRDPDVAASMISKAADLAAEAETIQTPDPSPRPPDVELA